MTAERRVAYVLFRLLLGLNLLGHGVIRMLHNPMVFAQGMVKSMADTPLPAFFVGGFGYCVPYVEFFLGLMLVFGFLTRRALTGAALLMSALMVGVTLKQDWPTAGSQLIYGIVIFMLMFLRADYDTTWPGFLRAWRERTSETQP